jgi:abortive infection bacteriophage resistance protein
MANEFDTMQADSTPHAYLDIHEADQAGSFYAPLKSPLSISQLADHLIEKGLIAPSKKTLVEAISTHGYYRLRGYWLTFECNGRFNPGTTLISILEIEEFNREISSFIFAQIAPMEICLRAQMCNILANHYGPEALHKPEAFRVHRDFDHLQCIIERETKQALKIKKPMAVHHIDKYGKLPIWVEVENSSLGTLSKAYENLANKKVASEIAAKFEITWPFLKNWLRHLTQIRNICAHHDRIYNKMFTVKPRLHSEYQSLETSRLFPTFIVLFRLHEALDTNQTNLLRQQLGRIIDAHPTVDLKPIGFPENWREVLRIPNPDTHDIVRPRGRNGGRPQKNAAVVEQALYQYDMREGSVVDIAKRCGLSLSTLYKYIHQREETEHTDYAVTSL